MKKRCRVLPRRVVRNVGPRPFDKEKVLDLTGNEIAICLACGNVDEVLNTGDYRRLAMSNYMIVDDLSIKFDAAGNEVVEDSTDEVVNTIFPVDGELGDATGEMELSDNTDEIVNTESQELVTDQQPTEEIVTEPASTTEVVEEESTITEETVETTATEEVVDTVTETVEETTEADTETVVEEETVVDTTETPSNNSQNTGNNRNSNFKNKYPQNNNRR